MTINYMKLDKDPTPEIHYWVRFWDKVNPQRKIRYVPNTKSSLATAIAMWNWARGDWYKNNVAKREVLEFCGRYDTVITSTSIGRFLQTFLTYDCRKRKRILEVEEGYEWGYYFMNKEEIILAAEQVFRLNYSSYGEDFDLTVFTDINAVRELLADRA